jgi:polynucleotide 5'-kinase involved in rRNA processing
VSYSLIKTHICHRCPPPACRVEQYIRILEGRDNRRRNNREERSKKREEKYSRYLQYR